MANFIAVVHKDPQNYRIIGSKLDRLLPKSNFTDSPSRRLN